MRVSVCSAPTANAVVTALVVLACVVAGVGGPAAAADRAAGELGEVWTPAEFIADHPGQAALVEQFADRVAAAPDPLPIAGARVRIALVSTGTSAATSWRRSLVTITRRLARHGVDAELHAHVSLPGTDLRTQAEQVAEALRRDPDYMIFTADTFRHNQIIGRLLTRDRPKVILDDITTPIRIWGATQPFLYVGFDHAENARLLANHYLAETGQDMRRHAIFYAGEALMQRTRGETIRLALAGRPNLALADRYYVGPDRKRAFAAALDLLRRDPAIDFIFATSSEIALGVSEAIESAGLTGRVGTNGWGGSETELQRLREGRLPVTLMQMHDETGIAIAEAIALDLAGRAQEVPKVFTGNTHLVTERDPATRVGALTRRAFRYSQ